MDTLSYGAFSEEFQSRWAHSRVPLNGTIEVTRRCPLECLHCYNNLPMSDHAARAQELTFDEHVHLLDELVDAGTLWLLYTAAKSSRARISSKFITTSPPGTGIRNTLSSSFASRLTSF